MSVHVNRQPFEVRLIYCSSVSAPVPGFASRSDEMGVAVRIVSYSVTTTTPGTGSSITSMIVSPVTTSPVTGPRS